MKRYFFLLVFIAASWSWGVTVTCQVLNTGYPLLKGFALAMLGAAWIAFAGLRLFFLIGPPLPKIQPLQTTSANWSDVELIPPDRVSHREPYIVK
jgi:hypothetical protein